MFLDTNFDQIVEAIYQYYGEEQMGHAFQKTFDGKLKDVSPLLMVDSMLNKAVKVEVSNHFEELYRLDRAELPPIATSPWSLSWFEASVPASLEKKTRTTKVGFFVTKTLDNIQHKVEIIIKSVVEGETFINVFGSAKYITADDGSLIIKPDGSWDYELGLNEDNLVISDINERNSYENTFVAFLRVVLSSIGLLNCNNIRIETHLPPAKLNKKRIKNGKRPLSEHKTILVERMKPNKVNDSGGQKGNKQRLHKRPGRWRDYREKGLFGKHYGVYYFSEHWAGNENLGVITHDYKI